MPIDFKTQYRAAVRDHKITEREAKELATSAKREDLPQLAQSLYRDSFAPGARTVISDAVKVVRDLGDKTGYRSKAEAITAARLARTPGAAVITDAAGRYHAVQLRPGAVASKNVTLAPPIDQKAYADLLDTCVRLEKPMPGMTPEVHAEMRQNAWKKLVAYTTSVGVDRVNVVTADNPAKPGMVNFAFDLQHNGNHVRGLTGNTVTLGPDAFKGSDPLNPKWDHDPQVAMATYLHELTHLDHHLHGMEGGAASEALAGAEAFAASVERGIATDVNELERALKHLPLLPAEDQKVRDLIHDALDKLGPEPKRALFAKLPKWVQERWANPPKAYRR